MNLKNIQEEFERDLADLLDRHSVAIIAVSQDDTFAEVKFQYKLMHTWGTSRCHVMGYDLDGVQLEDRPKPNEINDYNLDLHEEFTRERHDPMCECLWDSMPESDKNKPMGLSCPCPKCSPYSLLWAVS